MIKTLFTRKTLITIGLACVYSLLLVFVCACIDGAHSIFPAKNIINIIAQGMNFEPIKGHMSGFIMVMMVAVFTLIAVTGICFLRRIAIFKKKSPKSLKMIGWYVLDFAGFELAGIGIGLLFQSPFTGENLSAVMKYLGQCVLLTTVIYLVAFVAIGALLMLIVNFVFVDKPFRFFGTADEPVFEDEGMDNYDVAGSFDVNASSSGAVGAAAAAAVSGGEGGGDNRTVVDSEELKDREVVFPTLSAIDVELEGFDLPPTKGDEISLGELCDRFRDYLAYSHNLYFDIDTIRFFVSGFAASHFEILEGLSGTGKSSLPRYFGKFTGANVLFMPVQATWRDKSNILGYFNEFSKTYTETEFLSALYKANYEPDSINIYVLDEMNISRVEYYFADLLSVLEYPTEDWKIKLMNFPHDFVPPVKLEDGYIRIPELSYFVGTANRDDSTFTITDKVYDRAVTMEFVSKNTPFMPKAEVKPIKLTGSTFKNMLESAKNDKKFALSNDDMAKIDKLAEFVYDRFDVTIGNRIINQIAAVVPAFVCAGGKKEDAIDLMLCKKLFAKLEGRFEEYVKSALIEIVELIGELYGAGTLPRSERTLNKIIRTL